MNVIHKFYVPRGVSTYSFRISGGLQVLTLAEQGNETHIWVLRDVNADHSLIISLLCLYTGEHIPAVETGGRQYVATTHLDGGQLVCHFFIDTYKEASGGLSVGWGNNSVPNSAHTKPETDPETRSEAP